jgi:glycosyltransferase involved in cell wall biosynthesis
VADGGEPVFATSTTHLLRCSVDVTAVPARPVGAGQYTLRLVEAVAAGGEVQPVLVARRGDAARWRALAPGAEVVSAAPAPRPLRLAWEQLVLPALLRGVGVTVHHSPHYTMPERSRLPVVVTVHDLSFFVSREWHERSKVLLFRRAIEVAARRATVVVCPSQVTADELRRWCPTDAPVVVAHHGVDARRFTPVEPNPGADRAVLAGFDERLGRGAPFVVFVGTLEPRKDVPTLVAAFGRVATRNREVLLVLAGGAGWGGDAVERAVAASGLGGRVVRTGYVPDDAVPAFLRQATAAAYPARYEGFGLPALEALACGTTLVTTRGTAMEEVAGDAAVLVDPGDVAGLAEALDTVLAERGADDPGRDGRRRRGLDVAAGHTWAASAARHVEAYRLAARGRRRPVRATR